MKQYILLALDPLTLIIALLFNHPSSIGYFYGKTIGEGSTQYEYLFIPAGNACGIGLVRKGFGISKVFFVDPQRWAKSLFYKKSIKLITKSSYHGN
jgi:hypothetical protein